MMCTTVLHGGVCQRTSTSHKSGNKMKEKKNKSRHLIRICGCDMTSFNDTHLEKVFMIRIFSDGASIFQKVCRCYSIGVNITAFGRKLTMF